MLKKKKNLTVFIAISFTVDMRSKCCVEDFPATQRRRVLRSTRAEYENIDSLLDSRVRRSEEVQPRYWQTFYLEKHTVWLRG